MTHGPRTQQVAHRLAVGGDLGARSSRMLTSTPGSGRPAWVRAAACDDFLGPVAHALLRPRHQRPAGEVSVIPQACTIRRPNSSA
jgi:hypothetical protein